MKKTTIRQNVTNADRKWYSFDATGVPLGKLAVEVAQVLRGKKQVTLTPHVDGGDYVVVMNIEKVKVSGNKEDDKKYYRHSGYLGNLKTKTLKQVRESDPERILREAVSGMLPKNRHRKNQLRRLRLVQGTESQYDAQKPELLTVNF